MDNLNVLTNENKHLNVAKPPPRVCPRCNSDKTKFCCYNNYTTSQPRYSCKNCRRYWTHGGALRNVPIGGSCRKVKRASVDQSVSRMVSTGIQQVNHQPFSYVQKNIEFVESLGDSSFAASVGNHLGSLSEIHGGTVTNVSPIQSFRPNYPLDFHDGTFEQDYYDVGSDSPLINQSFGGYVDNHNGYRINQVNQYKWNQSFNNTTNMNHNTSTSGSKGSDMNMDNDNNNKYKNSVIRHPCHLEKHGA